jgi:antitoxin component YwqK of YwqJK toxin-antitoxin module
MISTRHPSLKLVLLIAAVCGAGVLWVRVARRAPAPLTVAPSETPLHDLVQHDGRWYRQGQTNPFTGLMVDRYPNGALVSRCQVSNGLLNGASESWYTNGQMQTREYFKDGVSNGQREKWHENGRLLSQAKIAEGKVTGTFRSWHDNGHLSEQIEMKLGKADGIAWAYYPSGFVKAETTVCDGHILNQKSWKDGERAASALPSEPERAVR